MRLCKKYLGRDELDGFDRYKVRHSENRALPTSSLEVEPKVHRLIDNFTHILSLVQCPQSAALEKHSNRD